jgi:putative sigma-54 modulation protein
MRVDVFGTSLPVSPSLDIHARIRVVAAVGRFDRRVERLTVRFFDANGPRGGDDKVCRIEVRAAGATPWVVEVTDRDPYRAADKAAAVVKRTLVKRLGRSLFRRGRRAVENLVGRMIPTPGVSYSN